MPKRGTKRREFCKKALTGLSGLYLSDAAAGDTRMSKLNIEPGIKIAEIVNGIPSDEELTLIKQLGVEYIELWVQGEDITVDDLLVYKRTFKKAGLRLFCVDSLAYSRFAPMILGLPGCEEILKQLENFIKTLGKAGLHTTTYGWSCGNVYSTGTAETRGCPAREYDYGKMKNLPYAFGREYSDEELWDTYASFIKRILPVAEDAGVRLAMHAADPPVVSVQGVPQIFRSFEAYKRAMEISNYSPYSGICFCVGSWGEMAGPDGKGEDIIGAIRHFGKTGNICTVHFRNVSSPLPRFHETFVDNGYINMCEVMKALSDVNYDGTMVPDHVPGFTGEKRIGHMGVSGNAYTIGYMKALLHAIKAEAG